MPYSSKEKIYCLLKRPSILLGLVFIWSILGSFSFSPQKPDLNESIEDLIDQRPDTYGAIDKVLRPFKRDTLALEKILLQL